jgi:glyoxylase-like metal-dependent hydrolase (beta-lactamase superfamily II)
MVAPYPVRTIVDGEVMPGISAVLQAGHTPGHAGWLLSSGGRQVFIWGDAVHLASVQIPRPDTGLIFDSDSKMAGVARRNIFSWLAEKGILVAGAHLTSLGYFRCEGEAFKFEKIAD